MHANSDWANCAGALAELQATMLKEGAEFKDLPLAADLGILAVSEFGAIMLQGGIIFTGERVPLHTCCSILGGACLYAACSWQCILGSCEKVLY